MDWATNEPEVDEEEEFHDAESTFEQAPRIASGTESVSLIWGISAGDHTVRYSRGKNAVQELETDTTSLTISDLKPGEQYSFSGSAQLMSGQLTEPMVTVCETKTNLERLLENLGLEQQYQDKLSLSTVLQIEDQSISDTAVGSTRDIAWYFLNKLMMVNVTARNIKCNRSACEQSSDDESDTEFSFDSVLAGPTSAHKINPLDIITALFLCSDGFVQQEVALKMSMCQFAVPLLLPNPDTQQCTLMLWALRDIVKKYRPQFLLEPKGFIEECIVLSKIPMVSFVRLGEPSMSKSEIINKLLSNSQQNHEPFVHHNMECGDCPRKISDGLVEITWYLPCGNKNIDIFNEPVTVANLRGDIASFIPQYSFLCQTSAAVFVFCDKFNLDCSILKYVPQKASLFFVSNCQSKTFDTEAFKKVLKELKLKNKNVILKTEQMNEADFKTNLQKSVRSVVENAKIKMQIEQMADVAHNLGIQVDEDFPECQTAKQNADAITSNIHDTLEYKETQLPLQGQIWKELTSLEKEECRLRNVGSDNIENYKDLLKEQKNVLRNKQISLHMSKAMSHFINAISSPGIERSYFLKWMRLNLDNMSREKLSSLRQQYKKESKESKDKEVIQEIDRQLSSSSLGIEHFFREMGQLYEASVSLPENHPSREQLQHLPKLCAELLLEGLPLELVDGDTSNIPLRWVSDVLAQVHELVSDKSRISVVTVLGVQSTGKSTLLNTMFGVQFAVSSGRCTRGAFMLLIKISEEVKKKLKCDFLMIIDTEGLKSPEYAQLDDSYEHDNELATLVVGLSDITFTNISMENSTEMKDILQIVVHAFLRMKEVGKKPKCLFIHQNVSDVSAHEKNIRDRTLLLEQLNEMTRAAAKMEKKENNKCFTDVMEYSPDTGNCNIPGLWNGNPPMAPVNAGYSEAVYELKKNIIQTLSECESPANNILEFQEWIKSLWSAVKHENFIFSFRNSLVAEAYMRLCKEYNKWEWDFKKHMYKWVTNAETKILNFGTVAVQLDIGNIGKLLTNLTTAACTELSKGEEQLLQNLKQYFKRTDDYVHLVEKYKEDFVTSAKSVRREMQRSITSQMTATADIKEGMSELDKIKKDQAKEIEQRVLELIDQCRKKQVDMTDTELDEEFDNMWAVSVEKMLRFQPEVIDVESIVFSKLWGNVSHKGSCASESLNQTKLSECGIHPFVYNPKARVKRWKHQFCEKFDLEDQVNVVQMFADNIIKECQHYIDTQIQRNNNYHDNYILEILHMIDERLQQAKDLKVDIRFEVSLKMHICGTAAREFQEMHKNFLHKNDPCRCLNDNKEKFRTDFKDVFHELDQCHKKAEEFTDQFLRPAVEDFVNRALGPEIIGEMLTCQEFGTRMFFQCSILKDLLSKDKFCDYLKYIKMYNDYVKEWIHDQIITHFSSQSSASVCEFENRHLQSCINRINTAIEKAKDANTGSLQGFVEDTCKELSDKLVISQDALGTFMILNTADQDQFANHLLKSVEEMGSKLLERFKDTDLQIKLQELSIKPQHELYVKLIGCGEQCPFCKAPCEAGAAAHREHWASLHQSQGLGGWRFTTSGKLVTDICTSLVKSNIKFWHYDANGKKFSQPFKKYQDIFPDWKIPPDVSHEASKYWKYVMARFNQNFAESYKSKPANIPPAWNKITKTEAEESLQIAFNIK